MARLFGDQREDHEAKIAVFQEAPDPAAAMTTVVSHMAFAHAAAPGMTAAVFVGPSEKMMMSVHIETPSLGGAISIYLNQIERASVFRYV
jgi:hypothetical protein